MVSNLNCFYTFNSTSLHNHHVLNLQPPPYKATTPSLSCGLLSIHSFPRIFYALLEINTTPSSIQDTWLWCSATFQRFIKPWYRSLLYQVPPAWSLFSGIWEAFTALLLLQDAVTAALMKGAVLSALSSPFLLLIGKASISSSCYW